MCEQLAQGSLRESGTAGSRTSDLLCREPTPQPLHRQATVERIENSLVCTVGQPHEDSSWNDFEQAPDMSGDVTDTDDVISLVDVFRNTHIGDVVDDADLSSPHDSLSYDSFRYNAEVHSVEGRAKF